MYTIVTVKDKLEESNDIERDFLHTISFMEKHKTQSYNLHV